MVKMLICVILLLTLGCASQNAVQQPIEATDVVPAEQLPAPVVEQTEQDEPPLQVTTPMPAKPMPKPVEASSQPYPDSFDGASINTRKYKTMITGAGQITQDDALITSGGGNKELIWNIIQTKETLDFTKDFTVAVDVHLEQSVDYGDAMALISIERPETIKGEMPMSTNGIYCELMSGPSHGGSIRTPKTGHGKKIKVPETKPITIDGTMKVAYDAKKDEFSCMFEDETGVSEVTQDKFEDLRSHVVVLRSGMHTPGLEGPARGSFKVNFDNLNIVK